jgi:predicted outer membrane repeat protein
MLAASAALAAMITGLGGGMAQAAARVPCSAAALESAVSAVSGGGSLSLASGCDYVLTAGLPAVTGTLTITGNAATVERSSAPGTPQFTILPVTGGNLAVTHLSFANGNPAISVTGAGQLSVTAGTFSGNNSAQGGAIWSDANPHAPVISGAKFTGNTATGSGGAIWDSSSADALECAGCTFTGNSAGGSGGAVWEFGLSGGITGSTLRGNTAGGDGGALYLSEDSEENLTGDTIQGNAAAGDGGGTYSAEGGAGVRLASASVTGNTAGGDGGGVFVGVETKSHITGTVIRGNRAQDGGGIFGDTGSSVIATGTVLSGNRATANGGGASGGAGTFGTLSLTGGSVSGNTAGGDGGGIYAPGEADFTGTPITGNSAAAGGGIWAQGPSAVVTLLSSAATVNRPDNCAPPGAVTGC